MSIDQSITHPCTTPSPSTRPLLRWCAHFHLPSLGAISPMKGGLTSVRVRWMCVYSRVVSPINATVGPACIHFSEMTTTGCGRVCVWASVGGSACCQEATNAQQPPTHTRHGPIDRSIVIIDQINRMGPAATDISGTGQSNRSPLGVLAFARRPPPATTER